MRGINIRRWDPSAIKDNRVIMIIGRRGVGKSQLQLDCARAMASRLDFGVAMTPTEDSIDALARHMPRSWIHRGFNEAVLENMIACQRKALAEKRTVHRLFVILDDVTYDKKVLKSKVFRDLMCNGRHLQIHVSCAAQFLMDLPPDVRANADYILACRDQIQVNRAKLYKCFFGMFDNQATFDHVFDLCTKSHAALVLDQTSVSDNVSDAVYWFRAEYPVPRFKLGSKQFRRLSRRPPAAKKESIAEEEERPTIVSGARARLPMV